MAAGKITPIYRLPEFSTGSFFVTYFRSDLALWTF
jgi:hypothetical protein